MKLRNLNGLIRKNEGAPKMRFTTAHGELVVGLVKSELLTGLADLFSDSQDETGLNLVDGFIVHENEAARLTAARRQVEILTGVAEAPTEDLSQDLDIYGDMGGLGEPLSSDDLDLLGGDAPAAEDDEDLDLLA